jgi:hypothetical protein
MHEKSFFHDFMDTVRIRTSLRNYQEERNRWLSEANLMLFILIGMTPTLSQTQVFDSTIMIGRGLAKEDYDGFASLFYEGNIQLKLFRQPSLIDAFKNALRDPDFDFSAWPEINRGEVDRKKVLDYLNSGVATESDLSEKTIQKIKIVQEYNRMHELNRYKKEASLPKVNLPYLIKKQSQYIEEKDQPLFQRLVAINSHMRSHYYKEIENYRETEQIDDSVEKKFKQLIDILYNRVISSSLETEFNILTSEYLDVVDKADEVLEVDIARIEPFTYKDIEGLQNKLTWDDVEKFVNDNDSRHLGNPARTRELAKFLSVKELNKEGVFLYPQIIDSFAEPTSEAIDEGFGFYISTPLKAIVNITGINEIKTNLLKSEYDKCIKKYTGLIQGKIDEQNIDKKN